MRINISNISIVSGTIFSTKKSFADIGLKKMTNLSFIESIENSGWEYYHYCSKNPLNGEEIFDLKGPFYYPIIFRPGNEKVLLLSQKRRIIENCFESEEFEENDIYNNVIIDVDNLVKFIVKNPHLGYMVTYANAYFKPHGNALRYLSFYGDDIGESKIFSDNIDYMSINRCGIRDIESPNEVMRIGSDGSIQFNYNYPATTRLKEIDRLLKFINENKYFRLK